LLKRKYLCPLPPPPKLLGFSNSVRADRLRTKTGEIISKSNSEAVETASRRDLET